mmetsp:Transcript_120955/g.270278  ORF Transcript_120955/g.270278 Transcript_120955/m.270278 type:complete len:222 (+) Transcript_120955:1508-2173(+)
MSAQQSCQLGRRVRCGVRTQRKPCPVATLAGVATGAEASSPGAAPPAPTEAGGEDSAREARLACAKVPALWSFSLQTRTPLGSCRGRGGEAPIAKPLSSLGRPCGEPSSSSRRKTSKGADMEPSRPGAKRRDPLPPAPALRRKTWGLFCSSSCFGVASSRTAGAGGHGRRPTCPAMAMPSAACCVACSRTATATGWASTAAYAAGCSRSSEAAKRQASRTR